MCLRLRLAIIYEANVAIFRNFISVNEDCIQSILRHDSGRTIQSISMTVHTQIGHDLRAGKRRTEKGERRTWMEHGH